jgi:hypothetical protein
MREQLLGLSHKIARVLREVLASEAAVADDSLPTLRKHLTPVRIWGLAVILASWELSKPISARPAIGALLGRTNASSFWVQLDLMTRLLTPFVIACRDAQKPEEIVEAATRFFQAVHQIGPPTIANVLRSPSFNKSARIIAQELPEQPTAPPQKNETKPEQMYVSPELANALNELERIAASFLSFLGWNRAEVASFLAGKR